MTTFDLTTTGPTLRSMRAVVQDRYGGPEVLRPRSTAIPEIGEGEVLVRVHAAGLDRGTWHLMAGLPYAVRLGFGLRRPRSSVPGLDVAGTVVAVGDGVDRFRPGDEVFGIAKGSFAEYAAADATKLASKPERLDFTQAAVTAVSGLTALQGLGSVGRMQSGDRVLIVGASGGVGSFAVQLAKAMGGEVTGVASTAKLPFISSLGADRVIDYTRQDFTDGASRYELILDVGGNTPVRKLRRALTETGTLVIVGGEEGGRWVGGIQRQLGALLLSPFVSQRLTAFVSTETQAGMEQLAALAEEGHLVPAVDSTFPLGGAAEAMRRLLAGETRGKIAITVAG